LVANFSFAKAEFRVLLNYFKYLLFIFMFVLDLQFAAVLLNQAKLHAVSTETNNIGNICNLNLIYLYQNSSIKY